MFATMDFIAGNTWMKRYNPNRFCDTAGLNDGLMHKRTLYAWPLYLGNAIASKVVINYNLHIYSCNYDCI